MKFVCFYLCIGKYLPHKIYLPVFSFSKVAKLLKTLQAYRPWLFQWEVQVKRLRLWHPLSPTLTLLQISTVSQSFLELQLLWILLVLLDYFVGKRDETALGVKVRLVWRLHIARLAKPGLSPRWSVTRPFSTALGKLVWLSVSLGGSWKELLVISAVLL